MSIFNVVPETFQKIYNCMQSAKTEDICGAAFVIFVVFALGSMPLVESFIISKRNQKDY